MKENMSTYLNEQSLKEALEEHDITAERVRMVRGEASRGYVYIIKCNEYYKIGISLQSPKKRLESFQVGNPYQLEILFSAKVAEYKTIEKLLHKHCKREGYYVRGEWFKLTDDKVTKLISILS
jgi:hypothetical protein